MPHHTAHGRVLIVCDDNARGCLAAVRSLSAEGWDVGVATPSRRSLVASSRHVTAWHRLGPEVADSVAHIVAQHHYDLVLPGGDAELLAISEGRDQIDCVVPYGSRESVRCLLDKWTLFQAGTAAGVPMPLTCPATDDAIEAVSGLVVLKSRSHASRRSEAFVSADPNALRAQATLMRQNGLEPLLQEHASGGLGAISLVVGEGGEVLSAVQQRTTGMWPPEAGISTRAETVPLDQTLLAGIQTLLHRAGWQGLAEVQFLETDDGPRVIDVNGRCYGSLSLAAAAGARLVPTWCAAALGAPVVREPATVGVRYQWLYGDLRRSWRAGYDLLGPLVYAARARHSVWDRRDVRPMASYLRTLAHTAATK